MHSTQKVSSQDRTDGLLLLVLLCVSCIALNELGVWLAGALHLPLFLDCIGTIVASAMGGYLPGIAVGFLTNLISSIGAPDNAYYGTLNVLIAVAAALFAQSGFFKHPVKALLTVPVFSLIGGAMGSLMTWFLYGLDFGTGISAPLAHYLYKANNLSKFQAQLTADILIDLLDKTVVLLLVFMILKLLPEKLMNKMSVLGWKQTPLRNEVKAMATEYRSRSASLRFKLPALIGAGTIVIAVAATSISYFLFTNSSIEAHTQMGLGVSNLVATVINGDMVNVYLNKGEAAQGYGLVEERLKTIRASSPDIAYVYVYKILEDGCHVVFDLDTEDTPASEPGEVIPFDDSFEPLLPALLSGQTIDPIITDDTYG